MVCLAVFTHILSSYPVAILMHDYILGDFNKGKHTVLYFLYILMPTCSISIRESKIQTFYYPFVQVKVYKGVGILVWISQSSISLCGLDFTKDILSPT